MTKTKPATVSPKTVATKKLSTGSVPKTERPPNVGTRGPLPGNGGAPIKTFEPEKIDGLMRLAQIGATLWEMAHFLGVTEKTLRERINDTPEIAAAVNQGAFDLKTSLRRKQVRIALDDSHAAQATMLIWAGKIHLGQSERVAVKIESESDALEALKRIFPGMDPKSFESLIPSEQ